MRFFQVTFTHTSYIEADDEALASEELAQQVRENAEANECTADEITEAEYDQYWADQLKDDLP